MAQARQVPDSSRHWYPGMGARSSARPSPPLGRRGVPKGWACSPAAQVTITCGDKDPTPGGQILFPLKEAGPQRPHSGVTRPPGAQPGLTSRSSAHHHERPHSPRGRQPFRCAGTKTKDTTGSFLQISGWVNPMLLPGNLTEGTLKLPVVLQEVWDAGRWSGDSGGSHRLRHGMNSRAGNRTRHREDFFCRGAGGHMAAAEHLLVTLRGEARRRSRVSRVHPHLALGVRQQTQRVEARPLSPAGRGVH